MKLVILAGGLGTRISEETIIKPKPMIEIGGKPILWHILKIYSSFGINEFIICCGYKGYVIKEYFANYFLHTSDVTFHLDQQSDMEVHAQHGEPWKLTLVDTGETSQTAGRLSRVKDYIGKEKFAFTYGDGLADINISKLISHHNTMNKKVTLTAVRPPGRYGALKLDGYSVTDFQEKPDGDKAWINGGFFIVDPSVIELINSDNDSWEEDILPKLALEKELSAFLHDGFWQPMDTLRDKNRLEKLWLDSKAPWKIW
jgi:glucose-1-phosphate cytidylyltransferase